MQFFKRLFRGLNIWLVICIGMASLGMTVPQSAAAQTSCATSYCLWLPLVPSVPPVRIVSTTSYLQGNEVQIGGFVDTTIQQPVYDVRLEAHIFDAGGALLQSLPISPTLDATLPGQTNPFYLRADVCCQPKYIDLRLLTWKLSSPRTYVSLPVSVLEWNSTHFKVAVRNNQQVEVRDIVVVVREGTDELYVGRFDALAPGAMLSYEHDALDPFGFRFTTWAQAYLQP
jgi:hypothetical protein